jgi:steroid delta-isomerase-like uncharacterized protein
MAIATPPTGVSNADVIRWSFEQLNRRDVAAMRQLWSDDTVERFPDRTCHGSDEIAAYFEETFAALPDLEVEVVALVAQGDDVSVRWHLTATQEGRIQGIDGTGNRLELDGADHFTLKDGKIVSNFVIFDQMQWARDIGLMPPEGSIADRAIKAAFNAKTRVANEIQARRSTS